MSELGIVFLMYHELEIPGQPLCQSDPGYLRYVLTEPDFRSQMRWLQQSGWQGVSVGEALAITTQSGRERRSVAFTFDDGCESDVTVVAPILQKAGYNATFYVTVGFIGQRGYMNSTQVRELSALGFEIGCHSMTHAHLTDLDDCRLQREIGLAKRNLEEILGKPVEHFSCPGGRYDVRVRQTARAAGYRSVVTSRIHGNSPSIDPFALGRIAILRQTGLPAFQRICRGEGFWKIQLHDGLRNLAKQLLGNSLYDRGRAFLLR